MAKIKRIVVLGLDCSSVPANMADKYMKKCAKCFGKATKRKDKSMCVIAVDKRILTPKILLLLT